jgi:DNA anti-recombination protein RmuC
VARDVRTILFFAGRRLVAHSQSICAFGCSRRAAASNVFTFSRQLPPNARESAEHLCALLRARLLRPQALEKFSMELDQSYSTAQPARAGRAGSARSRSSSIASGVSATAEGVPPLSRCAPPAGPLFLHPRMRRAATMHAHTSPYPYIRASKLWWGGALSAISPAYRAKPTYTPVSASSALADVVAGGQQRHGVSDDIGSLSSSLKSLATLVQTMDYKLADERAERLRLEERVKVLERGGDESKAKLGKLEASLQHQLDEVNGQWTASNNENREAWGALNATVETYNDEIEDRVNQLAKTLVSVSRDAKERSEAIERDFQAALEASATMMDEQAAKVDSRFTVERKATADKWDAVERNLTSRMEPLDARLAETRASLTRMLEESNRGHTASRERQQKLMAEQSAKLRQQITDSNGSMTERMEKALDDMEEKVGKSVEDVVQLLGRLKNGLEDKQNAMDRKYETSMDDQLKTREKVEARLREEIAGARTELRELVKATKDDLERADSAQTAELTANLKTTADDLAYDLDTLKEELVAAEEGLHAKLIEEQVAREALEADFGNKLGSSVHLLGDLIDGTKAELQKSLDELSQKVDVEVNAKITALDTDINERLGDLKELVEVKVSKSIDEMTTKMDTMNARIKQVGARKPTCAPRQNEPFLVLHYPPATTRLLLCVCPTICSPALIRVCAPRAFAGDGAEAGGDREDREARRRRAGDAEDAGSARLGGAQDRHDQELGGHREGSRRAHREGGWDDGRP